MTIFIVIWSLWFFSELVLKKFRKSNRDDKNVQDKGTLRIIWISVGIGNTMGILFNISFHAPISKSLIIPYSGLSLIVFGMIFRFIAIWTLGRLFTVEVTIRNQHHIKKDGLYKFIRHPSYTGMLLSFIGFGLSLNNWISLIVIIIPVIGSILYRIQIEENLLVEHFADEYLSYIRKTKRLFPWIY